MSYQTAIANAFNRTLAGMLGVRFNPKHNHYKDFGWPEHLTFNEFYRMYRRNSIAQAAIEKTIAKTWETFPALWESEKPADSKAEKDVAEHFNERGIWRALMTADKRSMIGAYGAAILVIADGKQMSEPVERGSLGIDALVEVIPVWEVQLTAGPLITDPKSADYGKPTNYSFTEAALTKSGQGRAVTVHPDRIIIWSEDGSLNGESSLESGYNDLLDMEKVKGAGGEGFWKTSRGAPIIEAPEGLKKSDIAKSLGTTEANLIDKVNEQLDNFQSGFDKGLMLGGMTAKPMTINLPNPDPFFNIPLQCFAASFNMPIRILVGNQTGERASTEDAREWAKVNMGRRVNLVLPALREIVKRLKEFGILSDANWQIGWDDLTDATAAERMDRASKMSEINSRTFSGDEPAFFPDEIREAAGYKTLAEVAGDYDPRGENEDGGDGDPPPPNPKGTEDDES